MHPFQVKEKIDGSSKAQDQQSQDPQPPRGQLDAGATRSQRLSAVRDLEAAPRGVPELRLVQEPRRGRGQLS